MQNNGKEPENMNDYYHRDYSWIMDRDMEHAVFGDSGRLVVAFGPQNGHTYDFRNFGMIDSVAPWIESGKIRVLCADRHGLQRAVTRDTGSSSRRDGSDT